MNPHSRSRHSSTTDSESATDLSCADSATGPINPGPIQHHQRFILTPNMYFQDTVYRTYSYAPPMVKNFAPILPPAPEIQRASLSTCIKQADSSSYRYRYYAPAGPVPASRLVKGEAAPKRFAPIESSMSFQNFAPRVQYPANQSFDGSYRNISFEPMSYESRHVEQYNRPVSNLWQMAGSSANTTNSSQKFLNKYPNDPLQPIGPGYNNYFQDKNLHKQSPTTKLRNNFKLKALAIVALVLVIVVSLAVILSVLITRSTMSDSTSLRLEDKNQKRLLNSSLVNETIASDSIVVGVDISLNVTSDKALFLPSRSNTSSLATAARLIFSKINSTSTNSNLGHKIVEKFKQLDINNGTIVDTELIDMLSSYSNGTISTTATNTTTNATITPLN